MVLIAQSQASLDNLRNAQSYAAQCSALRALKNETVGHVLKKEKWVEVGVLQPIVKVILSERPSNWITTDGPGGGRASRDGPHNRRPSSMTSPDNLPQDDLARLQALELLGIFASGGPSFLAPLHAAGALPVILSCIDPNTTHPRLVYAALRSIVTVTKAAMLVSSPPSSPNPITLGSLADAVFVPPAINALYNILCLAPRAWWTESIVNTAVSLITPLCRETRHQMALAKAGILDALAVKVASYVVAQGQVVPGADVAAEKEGLRDAIPEPATPRLDIAAVLDAIAAIIGDSRLRACMLLYAPSILAIFPQLEFESSVNDIHAAWKALNMGGLSNLQQQSLGALDLFLPAIPSQQSRAYFSQNSPFPPLGLSLSRENLPSLNRESSSSKRGPSGQSSFMWGQPARSTSGPWNPASALSPEGDAEEAESPMIPWLISFVRSTSGKERLTAASVLTLLYKAGFANKSRETAIALLIVPLLMQMLDEAANAPSGSGSSSGIGSYPGQNANDSAVAEQQAVTETALTVLARLVANSDLLQKAAVDCHAIKILAKLLKESYEPVPTRLNPRPWNPTPRTAANASRTGTPDAPGHGHDGPVEHEMGDIISGGVGSGSGSIDNPDSPVMLAAAGRLGPTGQNTLLAYRIRLREATLKALTALVASKYDYQKMFVEQEAMVYVVASLNPTPSKPRSAKEKSKPLKEIDVSKDDEDFDPEYGRNPVGVLVAACNCVRMLSRSIAILRTTLEDAGVATPIFRLLRHTDIDVQIAATGVICNLVTETSPMRERFAEAGIMKVLCEHAHSLNSPLRLNALWALKHFVDGVEPAMKKACLEQLGSGWLVQLIDPDVDDESTTPFFARARSYRGLASTATALESGGIGDDMDEDVEMDRSDEEDEEDEESRLASVSGGKMPWTAATHTAPAGSPSLQRANFPQTSHERSRTGRLRQAEAKMAALREIELSMLRKSRNDDVVIQEQGLNFIRNLIGPGSYSSATSSSSSTRDTVNEATEMIDYLFSEIGQDRLFQILLSKLKVKVLHHPQEHRRSTSNAGTAASASMEHGARVLQHPQVKIIEAVVFILVHISASVPRHRQVVVAQTDLLRALINHFSNRDKGVRVALCHLLTNLTWRDDAADTQAASTRTLELKRLGLLTKLQVLQQEDLELDVREQAKMAIHQMGPQNF